VKYGLVVSLDLAVGFHLNQKSPKLLADNMGSSIVENKLQYNRMVLDTPTDQAEMTPALSDLSDFGSASVVETPIFLSHSRDDGVVPIANGKKLYTALEKLGMVVTWKLYEDGGHWINEPQGVDDIVSFIRAVEFSSTE
jgi:predicted esterase